MVAWGMVHGFAYGVTILFRYLGALLDTQEETANRGSYTSNTRCHFNSTVIIVAGCVLEFSSLLFTGMRPADFVSARSPTDKRAIGRHRFYRPTGHRIFGIDNLSWPLQSLYSARHLSNPKHRRPIRNLESCIRISGHTPIRGNWFWKYRARAAVDY